jgi:alkylation response protein AidB-like acyl-CoA dehydrogenase
MYVNESMVYRIAGDIESRLEGFSWAQPGAAQTMLKAVEEFAVECSFAKVFGSETLDYVVDEAVQIHGGYGYHQDYAVERAYRDSRINRIFEGTNEINRLLATGMLLKRAQKGTLPLVAAVKRLQSEILEATAVSTTDLVANARKIGLFLLGVAYQKFGGAIEEQQEVMAGISDVLMYAYAMESAVLRARKSSGAAPVASQMAQVFSVTAMDQIEVSSRAVAAACAEGDELRAHLSILRRLTRYDPPNVIALRREIAARLLESGRYIV